MSEPCCIASAHGAKCDCVKLDALALAYGLLWHMHIDRRDPNLRIASDARTQLSNAMSMDLKGRGIQMARDRMKAMRITTPPVEGIDPDWMRENRDEIAALWHEEKAPGD